MKGKFVTILNFSGLLVAILFFIGSAFGVDEQDEDNYVADYEALPTVSSQMGPSDQQTLLLKKQSGFDSFNAQYQNQWKANFSKNTGKVQALYGGVSRKYGDGPENVAKEFLRDSHLIFGLKKDLSDLKTVKVHETAIRNHVRFQQTLGPIPVSNALVLVHTNQEGQVTMVQNSYIQDIQVVNKNQRTEEEAQQVAMFDLKANLAPEAVIANPKAKQLIVPYQGKYYYAWKITFPTRNPFGLWVYHVDAESLEILYKGDEITALRTGKGRAYKDNVDWHRGKISTVSLNDMFTMAEQPSYPPGILWGSHATVYHYDGGNLYFLYSPTYQFLFDPNDLSQKYMFDMTHTYYQMNTIWDWWNKNVIKKYGPPSPDFFYSLSIPVVVDYDACNSFYSPDLGWGEPGLVFGDEKTCSFSNEDFAVDNDVLRHEFTHAIMDWCGFDVQFNGEVNHYGRAMGEGNSDWFAYYYSLDPKIGNVVFNNSPEGYIRNLDNTRMYPRDVDDPSLGKPEEHYTSEIWSGYLFDLYRALKAKSLSYYYESFDYFSPSGGNVPDEPDFFDAIYAQMYAEFELTGKLTNTVHAWGSMASRGLNAALRPPYSHSTDYFGSGNGGSDEPAYFTMSFPPLKSIKTKANLLLTGDSHEYVITITKAVKFLTATVEGTSGGIINPKIRLYQIHGKRPLGFAYPSSRTKATLPYYNLPVGEYVVWVTGQATAPARGYYNFTLSIK